MTILAVAEQHEGKAAHSGLCAIFAAQKLAAQKGSPFDLLVPGAGAFACAKELGAFGASNVFYAKAGEGETFTAEGWAGTIARLVGERGYSAVIAAATSESKDYLPRVAGLLRAGMVSEAVGFEEGAYLRHMFAGSVVARVAVNTAVAVVTIREAAFEPVSPSGGASALLEISFALPPEGVAVIERRMHASSRSSLTEAKIVVGAGRGIKNEAGLRIVEELADLLGASIGASRATVDEGLLPNDLQIGQTGKVIAPELYLACGVSGAIQHTAGVKDSKIIAAINKDPEAPIFGIADVGLVADFAVAGPELVLKLKELL
ncbi:electron transfer flavoprotein subunit alpha/FixB family protein [bacterium]|nr:MAG: electron transfer flavoprotein subunit alpha/FixB family protein [bacterium]